MFISHLILSKFLLNLKNLIIILRFFIVWFQQTSPAQTPFLDQTVGARRRGLRKTIFKAYQIWEDRDLVKKKKNPKSILSSSSICRWSFRLDPPVKLTASPPLLRKSPDPELLISRSELQRHELLVQEELVGGEHRAWAFRSDKASVWLEIPDLTEGSRTRHPSRGLSSSHHADLNP